MVTERSSAVRPQFWVAASVSLIIAAVGFWVGPGRWLAFASGNGVPNAETLRYCTYFALAWIAWFVLCAFRYRWKALWFLPLAPFAILWPAMFLLNGLSLSELFHR
jgi:hypothetical protein